MLSSRSLLLVVALLCLLGVCNGFPTQPSSNNTLVRRQCLWDVEKNDWVCTRLLPTLGHFIKRMRNPDWVFGANELIAPVFYTNLIPLDEMQTDHARREQALSWVAQGMQEVGRIPYYLHGNVLNDKDRDWLTRNWEYIAEAQDPAIIKWFGDTGEAQHALLACFDQALALAAQYHTAYLFTRFDQEPREDSAWEVSEFPALTRNGGSVNQIIRIDPRPYTEYEEAQGYHGCDRTVLWTRGVDAPKDIDWVCPFYQDDGESPAVTNPWHPDPPPKAAGPVYPEEPPPAPDPAPAPAPAPIQSRAAKLREEQALQTKTIRW